MSDLIQIVEDVVHVSVDETRVEVVSAAVQGPAGRDGSNGAVGQDGQDGANGAPGPEGPRGPQGAPTTVEGLGLERVDDTRDVEKPVSEAQADAIEAARDAAEDYTDAVAALKADFPTLNSRVPIRDASGNQGSFPWAYTPSAANQMPVSNANGVLRGGTAVAANDLVPKAQVDALVPIYGTGFPNGVVSATVGRTYVDTAATSGAIEWKKAVGTGNTGWVVSVGDTGWRNVTTDAFTALPAGQRIYMRRKNEMIYFELVAYYEGEGLAAGTAIRLYDTPVGFRVERYTNGPRWLQSSQSPLRRGWRTPGESAPVGWLVANNDSGDPAYMGIRYRLQTAGVTVGGLSYSTADAWPTILPGTAA